MIIKEAMSKLIKRENLTYGEAYTVMCEMIHAETTNQQNAAFMALLAAKNKDNPIGSIDEITGFIRAMRENAVFIDPEMPTLEIVGTGGDHANTFNISTTSAMVVAASGVKVSKHGNRSFSSKCGSADCLEALGINISLAPQMCLELLKTTGFCYFYAPLYHNIMRRVDPVRKELGFKTIFNILGPLINPAKPELRLMGVYDEKLIEPFTEILINIGVKRGMVVYGTDCQDEISASSSTIISEIDYGSVKRYVISPELFGLERGEKAELVGGNAIENAEITKAILKGERGTRRTAVLLNAGAGLYIAGKAASIEEGIQMAARNIDSGEAYGVLEKVIEVSNR